MILSKAKRNYKKGIEMIMNFGIEVKAIRMFKGREGYGVNANIYIKGMKGKQAECIDSGNGGELTFTFMDERFEKDASGEYVKKSGFGLARKYLENKMKDLPKFKWADYGYDDDFGNDDETISFTLEDVFNLVIDIENERKELKKHLLVATALGQDGQIYAFKGVKSSVLNTKMKGSEQTYLERLKEANEDLVFLNPLRFDDAFHVWLNRS